MTRLTTAKTKECPKIKSNKAHISSPILRRLASTAKGAVRAGNKLMNHLRSAKCRNEACTERLIADRPNMHAIDVELAIQADDLPFTRENWISYYYDPKHVVTSDCGEMTATRAITKDGQLFWLCTRHGTFRVYHSLAHDPFFAFEQAKEAWEARARIRKNWKQVEAFADAVSSGRFKCRVTREDLKQSALCELGAEGFLKSFRLENKHSVSAKMAAFLMSIEPQVGFVLHATMTRLGFPEAARVQMQDMSDQQPRRTRHFRPALIAAVALVAFVLLLALSTGIGTTVSAAVESAPSEVFEDNWESPSGEYLVQRDNNHCSFVMLSHSGDIAEFRMVSEDGSHPFLLLTVQSTQLMDFGAQTMPILFQLSVFIGETHTFTGYRSPGHMINLGTARARFPAITHDKMQDTLEDLRAVSITLTDGATSAQESLSFDLETPLGRQALEAFARCIRATETNPA